MKFWSPSIRTAGMRCPNVPMPDAPTEYVRVQILEIVRGRAADDHGAGRVAVREEAHEVFVDERRGVEAERLLHAGGRQLEFVFTGPSPTLLL